MQHSDTHDGGDAQEISAISADAAPSRPQNAPPSAQPPKYNAKTYGAMVLIGFGLLLPFNFVLNSIPYFSMYFGNSVAYDISVAFTTPQLFMQPLMLSLGHLTSPQHRLIGASVAQSITMATMPFLGIVTIQWNTVLMAFGGMATAIMESSLFGFCSMLPPEYTQGVMVGEAVAGLLSSGAQLFVKALLQHDPVTVARVYFITACITMLVCAITVYKIQRSAVVQHYVGQHGRTDYGAHKAPQLERSRILIQEESVDFSTINTATPVGNTPTPAEQPEPKAEISTHAQRTSPLDSLISQVKAWLQAVKVVLQHSWMAAVAVLLNFIATFLTYPGITASIPYRHYPHRNLTFEEDPSWWTVLLFLCFGFFDLVGRLLAARTPKQGHFRILIYAISRFMWVPLLVGCARGWPGFQNDVVPFILVALSATTNGHCVSLCMMEAPLNVPPSFREMAGFVQVLFLHSGISGGSVLALTLE